jgi:3-methylcrotonyl-CoA carboxylase beta subunit
MAILASSTDTGSLEFRTNAAQMKALVAELQERRAEAAMGGPARARERHAGRGKLLPRERVLRLIDPGTPFLELSPLAALGMYEDAIHGAGLITGIGRVEGRECMILANDATIKGGTYFPLTVKKHLRAQEIAFENRLPCIYLVDSGGANLPRQTEVFPDRDHFGRIFYTQANLSAAGIAIAVVMGSCRGRRPYCRVSTRPSSCTGGTIFLGSPPLVKAATGEGGRGRPRRRRLSIAARVADHYAADDAMRWRVSPRVTPLNVKEWISRWRRAIRLRPAGSASCRPSLARPSTSAPSSRGWSTAPHSTSSRRSTAPRW